MAIIEQTFKPFRMDRPSPDQDRMIVGAVCTIATRRWEPLTGQARTDTLAELRGIAASRTDLLIEAAGVTLGVRPPASTILATGNTPRAPSSSWSWRP
jgi:hypothetical protein